MSITVIGLNDIEGTGEETGDHSYRVSYKSTSALPPSSMPAVAVSKAVVNIVGIDIGSPYVGDSAATCRSVRSRCIKRIGKGTIPKWEWSTDFEFSSRGCGQGQQGPTTEKDPTKRPVQITVSDNQTERAALADRWGDPIENSARDPVIRMRKWSQLTFRWTKYLDVWDWSNNIQATGPLDLTNQAKPVNPAGFLFSRNWYLWSPAGPYKGLLGDFAIQQGMALITSIHAEIVFEGGKQCVKVDVDIAHDKNHFYDVFLDQGFFHYATAATAVASPHITLEAYLAGSNQEGTPTARTAYSGATSATPTSLTKQRFRDVNGGGYSTTPQLLDGYGNPLQSPETSKPVYRSYCYYHFRDWTVSPMGGPGGFFDNQV